VWSAGGWKVGEKVEIVGIRETMETVVDGVEMFRKILDDAQAGDNIGCCCGEWTRTGWSGDGGGGAEVGEAAHEV